MARIPVSTSPRAMARITLEETEVGPRNEIERKPISYLKVHGEIKNKWERLKEKFERKLVGKKTYGNEKCGDNGFTVVPEKYNV